jgi:hypothetical protein
MALKPPLATADFRVLEGNRRVAARLSEPAPKINRLSRLIEAFSRWRSEAIEWCAFC